MNCLRILPGLILFTAASGAWAGSCSYNAGNPTGNAPLIATMPLAVGSITVGRDVPLGTEVYRQTFHPSSNFRIFCPSSVAAIIRSRTFAETPLPLSGWSGSPYGGRVYETGVRGIGVVILHEGKALPHHQSPMTNQCGGQTNCNWTALARLNAFDLSFIKIGEVLPGVIQGASLPTAQSDWTTGSALTLLRMSVSGAIGVVSRTCKTADVPVELGTHQARDLKGPGSATPWKDFEIRLLDCPAFHGYYTSSGPIWYPNGDSTPGTPTGNVLRYRLDPTNGAIDMLGGVIRLNASAPGGAAAATGIGIQIADRSGTPVPLSTLAKGPDVASSGNEGASYSIPLRARYLQTGSTVTPGPANGAVTFTIDYQ
ncbi:fimbrial protein [Zestomonas carbonaria]|uniref:Fimbrial-type adhesion domain-containing protein n=1 Tax=Zestomonas carbonaria TaxID=2762745 RepID=A0A7U7ETF9_9GAMM|nr:fimbrial protein [Pseudomonas carbonaria]CAD5110467.1 hypothetical protein PSEWESI4_04790 [Pseudomonas carbonaria]